MQKKPPMRADPSACNHHADLVNHQTVKLRSERPVSPKFRNSISRKKAQEAQKQIPSSEFGHQTGFTYRVNRFNRTEWIEPPFFCAFCAFFAAIRAAAFRIIRSCRYRWLRSELPELSTTPCD